MKILAIETSCDDTGIAILSASGDKKNPRFAVHANLISSQTALHAQYGGVFPMMAKREHSKNIVPLFLEALKKAGLHSSSPSRRGPSLARGEVAFKNVAKILNREPELLEIFLKEIPKIKKPKIDHIAVTVGPGLEPTLWVGINFAKALSYIWDIPLIPVNHMEGHVLSVLSQEKGKVKNPEFPAISLLVSGGHTEIVLVKGIGKYKILGATRDDAAGEAFDKVARMMGLPYPGGPEISRLARIQRTSPQPSPYKGEGKIHFPRPMIQSKDFDFSFSGLKTAVLYHIRDTCKPHPNPLLKGEDEISEQEKMAIAKEFEDAVVEVLVYKPLRAAQNSNVRSIIVGGGVSANTYLKSELTEKAKEMGCAVYFPARELSTDNALMIGMAGYFGKPKSLKNRIFKANGNLGL